jgi:hypothetical protein
MHVQTARVAASEKTDKKETLKIRPTLMMSNWRAAVLDAVKSCLAEKLYIALT